MSLHPNQLLELGIRVQIRNKRGYVLSSRIVAAPNGGTVALHKVHLTEIFKRSFGGRGEWLKMKPVNMEVNYAAIYVI